jgi:ribonucleotide monophosphatase NagD (HAD superfamily)
LGKKLVILSNTSAPAQTALDKLPKLGFDPGHFVGAVTSGEEASRYIRDKYCCKVKDEPTRAIFLTWADSAVSKKFIDKCKNLKPTVNFDEAELVIAHGSEIFHGESQGESVSLGSFMEDGDLSLIEPLLKKCKEKNLPMICANPDFVVKVGDGSIAHMPGEIIKSNCSEA